MTTSHHNPDTSAPITVGEAVAKAVRFGSPGRCPVCGEPGFLDYLDLKRGVSDSSCKDCRITWNFVRGSDGTAVLTDA